MQWFEPLIAIGAILFVVLVIFFHFYNKKKGKGSCDCGGSCSSCNGNCHINCQKILEEYRQSK